MRVVSPSAERPLLSPSTTYLPRWSHAPISQMRPPGRSRTQDAPRLCCTPPFHLPWGTLPASSPGSHSPGRGPGSCPAPAGQSSVGRREGLLRPGGSHLRPSIFRAWKRQFKGTVACPPDSLSMLSGQVRSPSPPLSQPLILTPTPFVLPLPQRPGFPGPLQGSQPQPLPELRASPGRVTPVADPQCLLAHRQRPGQLRSVPQQEKLRLRGPWPAGSPRQIHADPAHRHLVL